MLQQPESESNIEIIQQPESNCTLYYKKRIFPCISILLPILFVCIMITSILIIIISSIHLSYGGGYTTMVGIPTNTTISIVLLCMSIIVIILCTVYLFYKDYKRIISEEEKKNERERKGEII